MNRKAPPNQGKNKRHGLPSVRDFQGNKFNYSPRRKGKPLNYQISLKTKEGNLDLKLRDPYLSDTGLTGGGSARPSWRSILSRSSGTPTGPPEQRQWRSILHRSSGTPTGRPQDTDLDVCLMLNDESDLTPFQIPR
jgi:hypothetical protein